MIFVVLIRMVIRMSRRITTQMAFVNSRAPYYNENELEVILVLDGTITVTKIERSFVLSEGEFTFINRHIVHTLESEKGAHILITKIDLSSFKHVFERMEYVEFLNTNEIYAVERPLKKQLNAIVVDSLVKLYQFQLSNVDTDEVIFEENQLMHLLFLNYQLITHIKEIEEHPTSELLERYYQIVEYIMNNIHQKIMAEDIISLVYMNPTYFSQFMKRIGGVGFKEFVYYRKLVMICKYLLNPKLTMNETALMVGITDMKSFYGNFKKKFNVSPSKWRHRITQVADEYQMIENQEVLNHFIEKNHIHRHRENTITHILKSLIECQRQNIKINDVGIDVEPYKAMGDVYDPDYQVYKHYGALTRTKNSMGAYLILHFPMKFLQEEMQIELLLKAINEHVLLFGLQTMRKDYFVLHANTYEELDQAKKIKSRIERTIGNLRIVVLIQS